jgi:hypothetical protein
MSFLGAGTIIGGATAGPVGAVAAIGGSILSGITKRPSDQRAAAVLPTVVSQANAGNLVGVAILDTRRTFGISAERAVWVGGYNQVSPQIIAAYLPVRDKVIATIPAEAQATPEAAAGYVSTHRITADQFRQTVDNSGLSNILANPKATPWLGSAALVLLGLVIAVSAVNKRKLVAA